MIKIGILGDIGSGKSFVAKQFGYPVFNADKEVSDIYKNDKSCFKKIKILMAFIPPPVEPAQAPIPARPIKKYGKYEGIELWSSEVNPVVVKKETVWKSDFISKDKSLLSVNIIIEMNKNKNDKKAMFKKNFSSGSRK